MNTLFTRFSVLLIAAVLLGANTAEPTAPARPTLDRALFFATADYDAATGLRPLQNPIKNARAIAGILKRDFGFETEVVPDPTLAQIKEKLAHYRDQYAKGRFDSQGQLLVFFSGHGEAQFNEGFYLPKDADPGNLWGKALPYNYLRGMLDAMECQHILVAIDACYSVNFDAKWSSMGSDDLGKRPGELSEGEKLLQNHQSTKARLFFTSDGEGDQTPDKSDFAKKLQEGLLNQGGVDGILTSSDVFASLSRADPTPHRGDFGADEPGSSFLFIRQRTDVSDIQAEIKSWNAAKQSNDIDAYQAFLTRYPNSDFAGLAQDNISSLRQLQAQRREADAWTQASRLNTIAAYQAFIQQFSRSSKIREAKSRILQLESQASRARDDAAYKRAREAGTRAAFQSYLDQQPQGQHQVAAQARISEIEAEESLAREVQAWNAAKAANTEAAYRNFLQDFPRGNFAEPAKARLATFDIAGPTDQIPRPRMIHIPGGTFQMGSKEESDEQPIHSVTVSDFELGETEVTNAQFCSFLNAKGNQEEKGVTWLEMSEHVLIEEKNGRFAPKSGMADHPVIEVSWYGANAYCEWLGTGYRLPTEAEWEYAAGGGNKTRTKWAGTDSESRLRDYGNYYGTGGKDSYSQTAPVKSFSPNTLKLYDMTGNVWEWCGDWYGKAYYASSPSRNPTGPDSGAGRVLRGGSWNGYPGYCRVANRADYSPAARYSDVGFRVARQL